MRDVLIHDYIGVDLDEVWNVASSRYRTPAGVGAVSGRRNARLAAGSSCAPMISPRYPLSRLHSEIMKGNGIPNRAARSLKEEHRIYSDAIGIVLAGGWRIEGRRVLVD